MKVLFVATVRSHIGQFHMPFIRALKTEGWQVDAAFKDNSSEKKGLDLSAIDHTYEVPFSRNPFKFSNFKAYFILKKIISSGQYDVVHCHTPMGAAITRLASGKARMKGTKVFYTAHGFHFYKGAPRKYWKIFFPVEKYLSKYTDLLLTINQEDFECAISNGFRAGKIVKVNGVGVDLSRFQPVTDEIKMALRDEYCIDRNTFVLLYAADLSERKNQQMIFESIAHIKADVPDLCVLLPGQPIKLAEYQAQCESLGIQDKIKFMGYRRDIDKLLSLADVAISSSRQEGLPINLVEAAAAGKYIIATDVRGNSDVVKQCGNGVLVKLNDSMAMASEILKLYNNRPQTINDNSAAKIFSEDTITANMLELYRNNTLDFC